MRSSKARSVHRIGVIKAARSRPRKDSTKLWILSELTHLLVHPEKFLFSDLHGEPFGSLIRSICNSYELFAKPERLSTSIQISVVGKLVGINEKCAQRRIFTSFMAECEPPDGETMRRTPRFGKMLGLITRHVSCAEAPRRKTRDGPRHRGGSLRASRGRGVVWCAAEASIAKRVRAELLGEIGPPEKSGVSPPTESAANRATTRHWSEFDLA